MKTKAMAVSLALALGLSQGVRADLLDQLTGGNPPFPDLGGGPSLGGTTVTQDGGSTQDTGDAGAAQDEDIVNAIFELEPNDSRDTATALQPGTPYTGVFQASSDQDWYHFQVTQAGAAALIEIPARTGRWSLTLQDSSGQVLGRFQNEEAVDRRFVVVLLQTGDYFLTAESLGDAEDYVFTVSGEGIALPGTLTSEGPPEGTLLEVEPNDGSGTATALKPDTPYSGRFQTQGDQDWYHFQAVSANSAVEVSIFGSSETWFLSLLDAGGNVLATQQSAPEDQTFLVVLPTRGDYFVQVSPGGNNTAAYVFSVSGDQIQIPLASRYDEFLQQAQRETEPNNHIAAANPAEPGRPVSGQLFSLADTDWFAMRTSRDGTLVNIEMPTGPARWAISVLDEAGNLLEARESSTQSDLLFSTLIEQAGKFYLVISGLDDSRADYAFNVTGEGLQNPADRNPRSNFHDAEIEFNDTLVEANPLTSAVQLVGQLSTDSDVDLYRLDSAGDEILSVELCAGNAECANQIADGSGPWVVYVFDGSRVTQEMLDSTVPLLVCANDQPATVLASHLYLSLNAGLLDEALLGIIDPAFGSSRRVEVGLKNPGTYYLAVSSPLRRDEDGSVVLREEVACGKDEAGDEIKIKEEKIIIFPFSDDQYELQIVQTRLTPSLSSAETSKKAALHSAFVGDVLHVPVVEINGVEYTADLRKFEQDGKMMFELLNAELIGTAMAANDVESLKREALRATMNGDVVHIPMAQYDGHYYSGDLRIIKENGRTLLELIQARRLD